MDGSKNWDQRVPPLHPNILDPFFTSFRRVFSKLPGFQKKWICTFLNLDVRETKSERFFPVYRTPRFKNIQIHFLWKPRNLDNTPRKEVKMGPKYLDVKEVPFAPNFLKHTILIIYFMKVFKKGPSKNWGLTPKPFRPQMSQKKTLFLKDFWQFFLHFWRSDYFSQIHESTAWKSFISENKPVYNVCQNKYGQSATEAHKNSQVLYFS